MKLTAYTSCFEAIKNTILENPIVCEPFTIYFDNEELEFLLTHPVRGATAKYWVFAVCHHYLGRTVLIICFITNKINLFQDFYPANLPGDSAVPWVRLR